jgi:hypothetical protein
MTLSTRQLTVAAEDIVAAQFALSGFDVLEQTAGQARSLYDRVVAEARGMMKVTVHGCVYGFRNVVDRNRRPPTARFDTWGFRVTSKFSGPVP